MHTLTLELFKIKNEITPEIMKYLFILKIYHYNLRNHFSIQNLGNYNTSCTKNTESCHKKSEQVHLSYSPKMSFKIVSK